MVPFYLIVMSNYCDDLILTAYSQLGDSTFAKQFSMLNCFIKL